MEKTTPTSDTTSFSSSDSSIEREHEKSSTLSGLSESDTSLSSPLSITPEHENNALLFSDSPITSSEHDALGHAKFAQRLAKTIAIREDSPCLTIGLYGAWGSGKTSILKMIKEELEKLTEEEKIKTLPKEKIDFEKLIKRVLDLCNTLDVGTSRDGKISILEKIKKDLESFKTTLPEDRVDFDPLIKEVDPDNYIGRLLELCESELDKNKYQKEYLDSTIKEISKLCKKNTYPSSISVMDFNPWFFRSEEALLQNFLSELSHTIEEQFTGTAKKTLGKLLKNYSEVITLATAPILSSPFNQLLGIAIKKVGEKLSSTSITEIKEEIEERLRDNKKKTVVFIDDIDRLDKEEIHALFKIIRLCADFPYVTYVLAFDYDVVAASLQERYCTDQEKNAGTAFLEKIIQVPLHVPLPAKSMFHNAIYEKLNKVLLQTETKLNAVQKSRFDMCFKIGILPKITTLRLSNLYCNALLFSLSLLEEKICRADLMIIEGVRLFYPKLYDDIRKNFSPHLSNRKRVSSTEEFFEKNLSKDTLAEASYIRTLLLVLFPTLERIDQHEAWRNEKRICSADYFPRYFMYAVPLDDIPDNEINDFLALFENYEESKKEEQYPEMAKFFSSSIVRKKCIVRINGLTKKQATAFLDFILCTFSLMEKFSEAEASSRESSFKLLIGIIRRLFGKVDEENKNKFLLKLVQDIEPLRLVIPLFWEQGWIWEKKEEDTSVNPHYKEALSVLARRIKKIDEESPLYTQKEINTYGAYGILRKELGYENFNKYLKLRFDTSPDDVDLFLENLFGWKKIATTQWREEESLDYPAFLIFFNNFIDPQYIAENLTRRFGEKLKKEYMPTEEEYFQVERAKQFMNWYTALQKG